MTGGKIENTATKEVDFFELYAKKTNDQAAAVKRISQTSIYVKT